MEEVQPEIIFLIAFVSGLVGNEFSHRIKAIKRSLCARAAVGLFSGFASGLIALVLYSKFRSYPIPMAVVIGLVYAFFMAKSKAFESVR